MEFKSANNLSKKLQININNIVREYWEMFILDGLYSSTLGTNLIFKGGTALRLIYNSPRFSEDLDFSLLNKINFNDFKKIVGDIISKQPELSIKEIYSKRNTYFVLIKFKQEYLTKILSIKIEISKRKLLLKKDTDFKLSTASSPTTNLKPLLGVFTLQRLFEEKKTALSSRKKARDLFDIWFIGQLLKKEISLPKIELSKMDIKQELNRFLPKNYQRVIPELIKLCKG
jgi:predicted nucleotidyltransferase component of viral defense system